MAKEKGIIQKQMIEKCPECGSRNIVHDYDTGEIVCSNCGLVINERTIDKGPEWKDFTLEETEKRSRVGMPLNVAVHDQGLSTTFRPTRDRYGELLPSKTQSEMRRLKRWQTYSRVHSSDERNLAKAMVELDLLCDKFKIPDSIKKNAAIIYRKALKKRLIRGRSIKNIVVASLYAACRDGGIPRTLNELAGEDKAYRKIISRDYRVLLLELNLRMTVADQVNYISKIAEPLKISGETQGVAVQILREAQAKKISVSKDPISIAAAVLYTACRLRSEKITQKEIAEVANITEVTVRNRYKELIKRLGIQLPSESE